MPAVLFYVQHLLGIGHLMRARIVAEALADAGCDVHLVTGGRPLGDRMPRGVRTVQLPPIHVSDAEMKPLRDADGHPIDEAYREQRRRLLIGEFDSIAPAAVVFETFPFGRRALHFELLPLLERIDSARPRPLVVASVRDILQRRRNPERERETLELARRAFDAILVHGDSRFIRFDATFPLASELDVPVHYTGFVAASADREGIAAGRRAERSHRVDRWRRGRPCAAARGDRRAPAHARRCSAMAIAGRDERLRRRARASVARRGSRHRSSSARAPIFRRFLRARRSRSRKPDTTPCSMSCAAAPAPVLVPFAEHGETEQRARAQRLRELGLAIVVEEPGDFGGCARPRNRRSRGEGGVGALDLRLRRRHTLGRARHPDARGEASRERRGMTA